MIPPLIVHTCLEQGIDLIAVTDHNSTHNIEAVQKAAKGTTLTVLAGMEIQTNDEVHSLCLFSDLDVAHEWQIIVEKALPEIPNDAEHFGEQLIVDETGDFIRRENRLLINSTRMSLADALEQVHRLNGLFIPAHVDRKAYGMIPILGFIPEDMNFDAIEISRNITLERARKEISQLVNFPILRGGDAHRLNEILGCNTFLIEQPTLEELRQALNHENERGFKTDNLQPIM
jgi:PHP family Zn ribbon phosphoesterase